MSVNNMSNHMNLNPSDMEANFDEHFLAALSTLSPTRWSRDKVEEWKGLLKSYLSDDTTNLTENQWTSLRESLMKFHEDVLSKCGQDSGGGVPLTPEDYAESAVAAIQLLKNAKCRISDVFDELCVDDHETEVKRILSRIVDNAVLFVEGGRPFERTDVEWVDPMVDQEFNQQLYDFTSAEQAMPDAEPIPWLSPATIEVPKLLPRDLLSRLSTPLKCGELDDHEDWEYSVTHSPSEEEVYSQFEPTFDILRKGLKDILIEEIQSDSSNVDAMASIDPDVVAVAAKKLEDGEIDVDFKSMFILPFEANHSKLVGIRDENIGNLISYKEVVKPPFERIVDKNLRKDPKAWLDPERPAGPQIRTYGWEPLSEVGEDGPTEETDVVKKKQNPDAFGAGSAVTDSDLARMEKLVEKWKVGVHQRIETKEYGTQALALPKIKDYLEQNGQQFGIIPESFDTPEEFLKSLDLPKLRGKHTENVYPLENEVIQLDPDWVGLDGSGDPHEPLVEEKYWKQLESFKKPVSTPLVDWKAMLSQDLEGSSDPEDAELRKYLTEITEIQNEQKKAKKPVSETVPKMVKDHPAKKRQLDKEFTEQWIEKFGSTEGVQGLDPRNFRIPEHLVSSEEYEEKFLTHPFTSSYVFHPNFVRFRRMTKNHPLYSEYAFKKLESPASFDSAKNLEEFKSLVATLENDGPQVLDYKNINFNEGNLSVDSDESKKWECEFGAYMTEKLSLLESFADRSRKALKKPDEPCNEENSEDLYAKVQKRETPKDCSMEFLLQPFTLEDFLNLPKTADIEREEELPSNDGITVDSSGSDDSDSDDDASIKATASSLSRTVPWRPIKNFQGYEKLNVLQMLSDAATLVETTVPKKFHPPPRVMEWIHGKYQPSTNRLKKWRKQYGDLFPDVNSPLNTPFLFMTEEQRLNKLNQLKPVKKEDPDNPWSLTEEEKSVLKNHKVTTEDPEEETKETAFDSERINSLEQRSGIDKAAKLKNEVWAEELDTTEAPDMTTIGEPAMEFPFELDNFQKQAIMALENGYNVFVSAHTSAGKTAVAEYAIAMSRKRRSRAIYTSPIKALSNQKYNDFKNIFDSVGLITGDVQLNESADCLIMTTEILRSMLFNSSEGVRDLEFVVLDEVHYMNDPERGHVWEEVLILLPDTVQIVMLSATVPNTMEFASWVGRSKKRKVMVCKTLKRPVPLKHYFYVDVSMIKSMKPSSRKFLLKDGDKKIDKSEWDEIRHLISEVDKLQKNEMRSVRRKLEEKKKQYENRANVRLQAHDECDQGEFDQECASNNWGPNKQDMTPYYQKKEKKYWTSFIKHLRSEEWMPTIVFAFSRKKCDELADLLDSPELSDMTTKDEKRYIQGFIKSQIRKLDDEDKNLPQIKRLSKHLANGIGVHHSGILPLMKEIVEILFGEGRVKLLIATETFAMGVNMPARTVVFYSINKFDGTAERHLLPAEYIQMAGRAGRRGEDKVGNVIIACQSRDAVKIAQGKLTIGDIEAMMTGPPCVLESQFQIAYRMLLNTLTKGSKMSAVNMMQQSYFENTDQQLLMKQKDVFDKLTQKEEEISRDIHSLYHDDVIKRYSDLYDAAEEYLSTWADLRRFQSHQPKFIKEVSPGKYIKFCCGPVVNKVGLIVSNQIPAKHTEVEYTVLALRESDSHAVLEKPPEIEDSEKWFKFLSVLDPPEVKKGLNAEIDMRLLVYKIKPEDVIEIYKDQFKLTEDKAIVLIRNAQLANIGGRTKSDSDLQDICFKLNASKGLKAIDDAVFARDYPDDGVFVKVKSIEEQIKWLIAELSGAEDRPTFIKTFAQIFTLKETERKKQKYEVLFGSDRMRLYPEYWGKMEILKELQYIVEDRVQMKGYMAARINKYELVMTEMLVRNVLKDLAPEEVAGLMSFIVYQTRGSPQKKEGMANGKEEEEWYAPTEKLSIAIKDTIKIINDLDEAEAAKGVSSKELLGLKESFGLVTIMYCWAKQESFAKVMEYTGDFQEGMLVRWIQQLVEALKEIESAARVMGNNDLPKKIQDAIKTIKRGIVFTPSLYTTL